MKDLKETRDLIQKLEADLTAQEALYSERLKTVQDLQTEIETLNDEVDLLEKVEQTLQAVSSKVLGQSTKTIDKLVTVGLHSIFDDQKLDFKTVIDKYRGKTSVRFELYENGQTAPLMTSYGGGVLAVVGVLLRVTTIIILGQRRILVLDESLSHLSEQYVPAASALLKKICADLGFTILMVSHDPTFAQFADLHYEVGKSGDSTIFTVI